MPLFSWRSCLAAGVLVIGSATAYTGSRYALTYEYSGTNFFDGWDFYSVSMASIIPNILLIFDRDEIQQEVWSHTTPARQLNLPD